MFPTMQFVAGFMLMYHVWDVLALNVIPQGRSGKKWGHFASLKEGKF